MKRAVVEPRQAQMANRRDLLWTAGAAALSTALFAGCSYTPEIDARLEKPLAVEPLPVTMGVYYPAELRDYRLTRGIGGPRDHTYILGPPSMALFDQVLTGMFARAVNLPEDPRRSGTASDVAAVIVPRIERFQHFYFVGTSPVEVEIDYRFLLLSPQGHQIDDWTVDGSGLAWPPQAFIEYSFSTVAGKSTVIAMREAAAKFVAGFRQQPGVAKWLAGLGLAHAPPPS